MNKLGDLSLQMMEEMEVQSSVSDLQRTEDWLEKRKGRFTGSKIKDLMNCGRATSKQSWGEITKLFDFGATAERYIYATGKERITGLRSMNASSKSMQWGTDNEPLLVEQLVKDGVITNFQELGFEHFGEYKNGGASVDGICMYKGERVSIELKSCVSWDGHYKRMYEGVHDKHDDFWQFQAEMLATNTNSCLYVVTAPMSHEVYDIQLIKASPIHQKQMLERCKIADLAIELWSELPYKEALLKACEIYKPNQD